MTKQHHWTDEERAIIRRDYKHTHESAKQIAISLSLETGEGITALAVIGQITFMGLAKSTDRRPWSSEEEAKLAQLIGVYSIRVVAKKMHRGIGSLTNKVKKLRLSWKTRDGWYTKKEVCEILGRDHKWVQVRIDSGALKASSHFGGRPVKFGLSAWHIDEKDLKAYIRRYPQELVGCNIDIMLIVDILAGVTNNGQ